MAKVGDIFVALWWYDQTNANFFQVIKTTNKSVTVRPIKKRKVTEDNQAMIGSVVPIKNAFDGKATTRRIYYYEGEELFNAGESYGSANKWNGKPVGISWYA